MSSRKTIKEKILGSQSMVRSDSSFRQKIGDLLEKPPENNSAKYSGFDTLSRHDGDPISVYALKMAYRKHAKHDDSIGWDELHDILGNALAQIMGDAEFVEWNESPDNPANT